MGFFVGSWLHEIPSEDFNSDGKQIIIKHLCFGPLETWLWYRLKDGRYCREIHFIEGLQEGERYTDFISKSEMLKVIENEIELCKKYNEINLAALLERERRYLMARTVAIGRQDFERIVAEDCFYVDKTNFIKEWWENKDDVTLITRPRRFGKTLTMNMVERFFSIKYAGKGEVFENLKIWKEEKFRKLQGTIPVISLTFANMGCDTYEEALIQIKQVISDLYLDCPEIKVSGILQEPEVEYFDGVTRNRADVNFIVSLRNLCKFLQNYYKKKVIILLDEFDTPLQDAYVHGYWDKLIPFIRGLFGAAFKSNPYLDRAILTGITRVSKESLFSGLNNLKVVSMTSDKYADSFGFTQEEVSAALQEFGLSDKEEEVRFWYDGFTFGNKTDIYNPWSITNFLDERKIAPYWANTSNNALINTLLQQGNEKIKTTMEHLLTGGTVRVELNDHIDFSLLNQDAAQNNENTVWNLFLASGYLKIEHRPEDLNLDRELYDLKITNEEIKRMFRIIIREWFPSSSGYNDFIKALLREDLKEMNLYMNDVALKTFSTFDSGKKPSERAEPERFYHGFVLGLMVDLADRYVVTSNRESGYGRYDVMLKPKKNGLPAIIMEFKVHDPEEEESLEETVVSALNQIEEKNYSASLIAEGFLRETIRAYGFAFEGKKVQIDGGDLQKTASMVKAAEEKKAAKKASAKKSDLLE